MAKLQPGFEPCQELKAIREPVLYLEVLFGPTLAEQFGLQLIEPAIDWLPELPEEYRKRAVVLADRRVPLARTAAIDVGVIAGRGWSVVEQNSAWGAGIYGCDLAKVLEVLRYAAVRH